MLVVKVVGSERMSMTNIGRMKQVTTGGPIDKLIEALRNRLHPNSSRQNSQRACRALPTDDKPASQRAKSHFDHCLKTGHLIPQSPHYAPYYLFAHPSLLPPHLVTTISFTLSSTHPLSTLPYIDLYNDNTLTLTLPSSTTYLPLKWQSTGSPPKTTSVYSHASTPGSKNQTSPYIHPKHPTKTQTQTQIHKPQTPHSHIKNIPKRNDGLILYWLRYRSTTTASPLISATAPPTTPCKAISASSSSGLRMLRVGLRRLVLVLVGRVRVVLRCRGRRARRRRRVCFVCFLPFLACLFVCLLVFGTVRD